MVSSLRSYSGLSWYWRTCRQVSLERYKLFTTLRANYSVIPITLNLCHNHTVFSEKTVPNFTHVRTIWRIRGKEITAPTLSQTGIPSETVITPTLDLHATRMTIGWDGSVWYWLDIFIEDAVSGRIGDHQGRREPECFSTCTPINTDLTPV